MKREGLRGIYHLLYPYHSLKIIIFISATDFEIVDIKMSRSGRRPFLKKLIIATDRWSFLLETIPGNNLRINI